MSANADTVVRVLLIFLYDKEKENHLYKKKRGVKKQNT